MQHVPRFGEWVRSSWHLKGGPMGLVLAMLTVLAFFGTIAGMALLSTQAVTPGMEPSARIMKGFVLLCPLIVFFAASPVCYAIGRATNLLGPSGTFPSIVPALKGAAVGLAAFAALTFIAAGATSFRARAPHRDTAAQRRWDDVRPWLMFGGIATASLVGAIGGVWRSSRAGELKAGRLGEDAIAHAGQLPPDTPHK